MHAVEQLLSTADDEDYTNDMADNDSAFAADGTPIEQLNRITVKFTKKEEVLSSNNN